jgi:hypothetical protein
LERSNDYADCGRDTKFNPLVLDEIHAADDTGHPPLEPIPKKPLKP